MSSISRLMISCALVLGACDGPEVTDGSGANRPAIGKGVSSNLDDLVRYSEDRAACDDRKATRNAYFGDLHIHTGYSYDSVPLGSDTTPGDAYRFAKGEPITLPRLSPDDGPTQIQQLDRPLDFAAVTDHSEFLGEIGLCFEAASAAYDSTFCRDLRNDSAGQAPLVDIILSETPQRLKDICGQDDSACIAQSKIRWKQTQEFAEAAYDRSSKCQFTTFIGYEYTGTPNSNNYHRNVIFRNASVPDTVISYVEAPRDRELWDQLTQACLEGLEGCDVLAIPHNSNLSSGAMFPSYATRIEDREVALDWVAKRNALEPIMEVFQHKGNSECFNGFPDIVGAPDELCDFEQNRTLDPFVRLGIGEIVPRICEEAEVGFRGFLTVGCISKNDYYRSVLLTGLQDQSVIGLNSYKIGVIASTDTHLALSGDVDESSWHGHVVAELNPEDRLKSQILPTALKANPGGLAGIWAVENSRDALFDALQRREVFGTSGPRIKPRLFGGWEFAKTSCDFEEVDFFGYELGVPMGGELEYRPGGRRPTLFATAERDSMSAGLQKLQIVKGWIDETGQSHIVVVDIAGDSDTDGEIDPDTGAWTGKSFDSLCAVFEDVDFEPSQPAYYYLRVVEVPTYRWSWRQCLALTADARPDACENDAPKVIQEMAWTSPIWYAPRTND